MITSQLLAAAFRLDGRSALVTGAGSGVGAAVAEAFAAAGAAVLVTDIDAAAAGSAAAAINAAAGRADACGIDGRRSPGELSQIARRFPSAWRFHSGRPWISVGSAWRTDSPSS